VGLQYTQANWNARLTAFENRYTDLIDNDANWTRTNFAKASNQGVEVALAGKWQLPSVGEQQWRLSFTSQDPQNDITHKVLMRRAKTLAQAGLSQTIDQWDTGIQLRYNGAREDAGKTLKAFTVVDLTASRALTSEFRLTLRLENASNADYQTIYGYNTPKRGVFAGLKWAPKY
jgi:vitamin B12 transporter